MRKFVITLLAGVCLGVACPMEQHVSEDIFSFAHIPDECWPVIACFMHPLDLPNLLYVRPDLKPSIEQSMQKVFGGRWRKIKWHRLQFPGGVDGVRALNFFYSAMEGDNARRTVFERELERCVVLMWDAECGEDQSMTKKHEALMACGCLVEQLHLALLFLMNRGCVDEESSRVYWKLCHQIDAVAPTAYNLAGMLYEWAINPPLDAPWQEALVQKGRALDYLAYQTCLLNALKLEDFGARGYGIILGLATYAGIRSIFDIWVIAGLIDNKDLMDCLCERMQIEERLSSNEYEDDHEHKSRAYEDVRLLWTSVSHKEFAVAFGMFSRSSDESGWEIKTKNQLYLRGHFRDILADLVPQRQCRSDNNRHRCPSV